jgi:hypothetical protein
MKGSKPPGSVSFLGRRDAVRVWAGEAGFANARTCLCAAAIETNPALTEIKMSAEHASGAGNSLQMRHHKPQSRNTQPGHHDNSQSVTPNDSLRILGTAKFRIDRHTEKSRAEAYMAVPLDYDPNNYSGIYEGKYE